MTDQAALEDERQQAIINNITARRAAAGLAYRAAAEAYVAAWIELHAHDLAAENLGTAPLTFGGDRRAHVAPHDEFTRDWALLEANAGQKALARHERILRDVRG